MSDSWASPPTPLLERKSMFQERGLGGEAQLLLVIDCDVRL